MQYPPTECQLTLIAFITLGGSSRNTRSGNARQRLLTSRRAPRREVDRSGRSRSLARSTPLSPTPCLRAHTRCTPGGCALSLRLSFHMSKEANALELGEVETTALRQDRMSGDQQSEVPLAGASRERRESIQELPQQLRYTHRSRSPAATRIRSRCPYTGRTGTG